MKPGKVSKNKRMVLHERRVITDLPVINLISLGEPNSLKSMESSTGINPSIVPFISSRRQLFMFTIPVFTSDQVS